MLTFAVYRIYNGFLRQALSACLVVVLILLVHAVSAQTLTIRLSANSLTFSGANPLSTSDAPALENPVDATVTYTGKGTVHIFMLANGNMTTSNNKVVIPVSNIYFTGTGIGYESGRLSTSQQVEASSGPLSHDPLAGWNFYLKHGLYPAGAFRLSITVVATVQ